MKKIILVASSFLLSSPVSASNAYFQIGSGVSQASGFADTVFCNGNPDSSKSSSKALYSAGLGYEFTDNFRVDLNYFSSSARYRGNKAFFSSPINKKVTLKDNFIKVSSQAAFLNAYYDFQIKEAHFKPYITLGLGISNNKVHDHYKHAATWTNVFEQGFYVAGKKKLNTAWNIGIGARVPIAKSIFLDLAGMHYDMGKTTNIKKVLYGGEDIANLDSEESFQIKKQRLRYRAFKIGLLFKI